MKILKVIFATFAVLAVGGFLITSFVERSQNAGKEVKPKPKPEEEESEGVQPKGSGVSEPYVVTHSPVQDVQVVE